MSRNRHSHHNVPQITRFQVNLDNGQPINEPIDQFNAVDEIIRNYGRRIIHSITFYFHNSQYPYYYLTLRNSRQDNIFVVEFFHYYNQHLEHVQITREEKERDLEAVMELIHRTNNLNSRLGRFIQDPYPRPSYIMT